MSSPLADWLTAVRCPLDGGLLLVSGPDLACERCSRLYRFVDGILILPPGPLGTTDEDEAVYREREQRDREAEDYDRLPGLAFLSRLEIPFLLRSLGGPSSRGLAADVGCGTGRLTIPLSQAGWRVLALDHSIESLRRLQARTPASRHILAIQGDARRLPFPDGQLAAVVSAQVLEHLPTPSACAASVGEFARVLRPGGRLALSAYQWLPWLPTDGYHSGEIPFHRFRARELRSLFITDFTDIRIRSLGYVMVVAATRR